MKSKFKLYKTLYDFFAGSKTGGIFPPFFSDLLTWCKGIFTNTWNEKINTPALNASILPRLASLNGTDGAIDTGITLDNGNSYSFEGSCFFNKGAVGHIIGADNGPADLICFQFRFDADGKIHIIRWNTSDVIIVNETINAIDYSNQWIDYIFSFDTTAGVSLTINGSVVYTDSNTDVNKTGADITIGAVADPGSTFFDGLMGYVKNDDFEYYLKGMGDYEYDVSGNNNHGTWSGTGTRFDYDINGSRYPFINSYSLWQKTGSPDIQAPFDVNGVALALTPGVNIESGYTKSREQYGSAQYLNMADCLIDFANVGDNPELVINPDFDPSTGGLGDDWNIIGSAVTTIVTGSGHVGNAQRLDADISTGVFLRTDDIILLSGHIYELNVYTRSMYDIVSGTGAFSMTILANTGNAKLHNQLIIPSSNIRLQFFSNNAVNDEFIEISSPSIIEISSSLENFNRSNTTIYNATARAGIDYDIGNPYRFQINNLDPRILFDFRNIDYKGMLFAKILMDANDNLIRIDEMLNYGTDKTDANEYQVMLYCGYLAIIVLDGNGDYLTDINGYIIIENL